MPMTRPLLALVLALSVGTVARAADFPLAGSKISLKDGSSPKKRKITFQGRFAGDLGSMNPNDGATLRVVGGQGEGDSGLIVLGPNWQALPKSKGFRYVDKTQSAGGISSILLRKSKGTSGRIKITGGNAKWTYEVAMPQTTVTVTMTIGDAKLCTQFDSPKTNTSKKRVTGVAPKALDACPCDKFDSTWEAIQTVIFERHGCTEQTCHGP